MENVDLDKIVSEDLIIVGSNAKNKAEILNELSDVLKKNKYISDKNQFLSDLYDRENEGETGIGQGIAIPHGKSKAVIQTTIAVGVLNNSIEWETLDGGGVNVVIMFAVKDTDVNTTHILLLQKVAILLANDSFIENIKQASSVDEVYSLIVNS